MARPHDDINDILIPIVIIIVGCRTKISIQVLLHTATHSIHFHLVVITTVSEMSLLFQTVSLPLHHHVIVMMQLEYIVEEMSSQVHMWLLHVMYIHVRLSLIPN